MRASTQIPLIISIKEMRKLLGSDGIYMTDDQVELLIVTLTETSSILLNQEGVLEGQ